VNNKVSIVGVLVMISALLLTTVAPPRGRPTGSATVTPWAPARPKIPAAPTKVATRPLMRAPGRDDFIDGVGGNDVIDGGRGIDHCVGDKGDTFKYCDGNVVEVPMPSGG
jgi:hypothetical protein